MTKNTFVEELKEGDRFDDLFLVKSVRLSETKAGNSYLILTVMDRSGELSGPIWDNVEAWQKICRAGEFIRLKGMVQAYRDKPQLKVDSVQPVDRDAVHLADFVVATTRDPQQMAEELQRLVRSVKDPYLRRLLNHFFKSGSVWDKFQMAPAAKGIHHAYAGGLLEHCLSMARVADMLAGHYEGVDRSLLITGALLHDIGKVDELAMEIGVVEYTDRGRLKGHLVIGCEMVAAAAAKINGFPPELLDQVQHLVLSHHGRQEFGSPIVPMTVEALLLSFIDDVDAKMNLIEQLRRKMEGGSMQWTEYQRSLERFLYLGGFEEKEMAEETAEATNTPARQQSLFS
ncbi:HD domain-containing protein [Desulfoprunum benzoelyticum]|uniref:3'-5' exoribonuclease n=1 Tax=Desulfoprunum benzoelyticum TaxID=1506996 RepID=A0A840UZC0_9BACT|nr:HD domain-containing protein [Desulfoprunum benzoelyticum]MBB5346880.1 3'-5' exoribonuclease [Desulfoprunum benzoelyticum]MBM9529458.1 HD domain-containing protein [Desulfoprunum benzoelyticum]